MFGFEHQTDPFSVEGLLNIPALIAEPSCVWQPFQYDSEYTEIAFELADVKPEPLGEIKSTYFSLDSTKTALPDIESLEISTVSSETEDEHAGEQSAEEKISETDEDIWSFPDIILPSSPNKIISWETFSSSVHQEPQPAYIGELEGASFDVIVQISQTRGQRVPPKVAPKGILLSALLELGLGRSSQLFSYDDASKTYIQSIKEFGVSGLSNDLQDSLINRFLRAGNSFKAIRNFINEDSSDPLLISLGSSLEAVIYATERYVEQSRHRMETILQLQQVFERPLALIDCLFRILQSTKSMLNGDEILENLISEAEKSTCDHSWLEEILHPFVSRTAAPTLKQIEISVGLGQSSSCRNDQLHASKDGTLVVLEKVLPIELLKSISEAQRTLQLLQAHQPEHPILNQQTAQSTLLWECSWEAIGRLQSQANDYQSGLRDLVRRFDQGIVCIEKKTVLDDTMDSRSDESGGLFFEDDGQLVDLTSKSRLAIGLGLEPNRPIDNLGETVFRCLFNDTQTWNSLRPPLVESMSLSITPFVKAQHRLLSFSVLKLLFKTYNLRSHLQLQYRFQLLTDGLFACRLGQALFDPNQASGEGKRKAEGVTGLRLQTRETWPPASSELRLVLMGILAESFQDSSGLTSMNESPRRDYNHVSEAMSFAIRDLSDIELEKCRNADSIHALDFLRLHYKAPTSLIEAVITPGSLSQLDSMFKYLLRLLRVKRIAISLVREIAQRNQQTGQRATHQFRIEIQHFISTLADYSEVVAIGSIWARFEQMISDMEKCVDRDDFNGAIEVAASLDRLRDLYEATLDTIMTALFLSREQGHIRSLLEEMFDLILRLAANLRQQDMIYDGNDGIKQMQLEFREGMKKFIRYLQAQTGAPTSSVARRIFDIKESSNSEQLLLRLNMFGYYD